MNIMFRAYANLGAHPELTDREIKQRHRILSQLTHPDREGGDKDQFMLIQESFRLIKGPEARKLLKTRLQGLGRECDACRGRGITRRGKGFTTIDKAACVNCGGCGYTPRISE